MPQPQPPHDLENLRQAILSQDPSRAMPAMARLRDVPAEQAVPLLLQGLENPAFLVRSLACAGLGLKRNEAGWQALERAFQQDEDANVRAEAANALVNYGVERSWPLLRRRFAEDDQWLVRCSILSALAEQPQIPHAWLLELARMAITSEDGTVRVGGAEILARLLREGSGSAAGDAGEIAAAARTCLAGLQGDPDHRVAAAALSGLHG